MSIHRISQLILLTTAALALAGCTKSTQPVTATYGAPASGPLTAENGMTLYAFDKDKGGKPACYDDCAVNWPPYIGTGDEKFPPGWKLVERTDGAAQWTWNGKPVYFFKGDKAEGDAKGDGKNGVWHVINV
jgi:predicted lipoprotein with Yx(FWY)xxD motif